MFSLPFRWRERYNSQCSLTPLHTQTMTRPSLLCFLMNTPPSPIPHEKTST